MRHVWGCYGSVLWVLILLVILGCTSLGDVGETVGNIIIGKLSKLIYPDERHGS